MGACSFTSESARAPAGGFAARPRSRSSMGAPARMRPSMVLVASLAPSAAGMSTMLLSPTTRPGRGLPEGRGENVASFMGLPGGSLEECEGMLRRLPARREERVHGAAGDARELGRAPARLVVLVHEERADAFEDVALLEAAVD